MLKVALEVCLVLLQQMNVSLPEFRCLQQYQTSATTRAITSSAPIVPNTEAMIAVVHSAAITQQSCWQASINNTEVLLKVMLPMLGCQCHKNLRTSNTSLVNAGSHVRQRIV